MNRPILTAETVQEIFPVAPRDRRENADLFESRVSREQLKTDSVFYAALAQMIVSDEVSLLAAYDRRMFRRDCSHKTFLMRAARYLRRSGDGKLSIEDLTKPPTDCFEPVSTERLVNDLYRRLRSAVLRPNQQEDSTAPDRQPEYSASDVDAVQEAAAFDWVALAAELARSASAMTQPSLDDAERIADLASELLNACRDIEARTRALEIERREALAARIIAFDETYPVDLSVSVDSAVLDRLQLVLDRAEAAKRTLDEIEGQCKALDSKAREVQEADDFDGEEQLFSLRKAARERRKSAQAELDAASTRLREEIGEHVAKFESAPAQAAVVPVATFGVQPPARSDAASSAMPVEAKPSINVEIPLSVEQMAAMAVTVQAQCDSITIDPPPVPKAKAAAAQTVIVEAPPVSSLADPVPSSWSGESDDERISEYLNRDEPVFAWHLARLSSAQGRVQSVPAPVLRGLVIGREIRRSTDMSDPLRSAAMAELMAALDVAPDAEQSALIALAALLRPALFDPDSGVRAHLANLPRSGAVGRYAALVDELAGLGFEVRLSVEELAELTGTERLRRSPAAEAELREWLDSAGRRKTSHQPTYSLLHKDLRPDGELGGIIAATLSSAPDAEVRVAALLNRLSDDRSAKEAFVRDCERRNDRPRRDRIEGMALSWFCDRIEEACTRLREWLDARQADAGLHHDRSRLNRERMVDSLKKTVRSMLSDHSEDEEESTQSCGIAVMKAALHDLLGVLEGRAEQGIALRVRDLFETPLLRLPGGCQIWDFDVDIQAEEIAARETRLLQSLRAGDRIAMNEGSAIEARLAEDAILAAHHLIVRRTALALEPNQLRAWRQHLTERIEVVRREMLDRVERLRQTLASLFHLDLETADSVRAWLTRLVGIGTALRSDLNGEAISIPALNYARAADVPPDFPELDATLDEIELQRDRLFKSIRDRQTEALEGLQSNPLIAESVAAILDRMDKLDPVTIDDAIADLRADRPVNLLETHVADPFTRFYPGFVDAVDSANLSIGALHEAIRDRATQPPFDYAAHDEGEAKRAKLLLEQWRTATNGLLSSEPQKLREALTKLLEQFGFTGVRLADEREHVTGRLRGVRIDFDVPRAEGWFLPPAFGSESHGRYRLLAVKPDIPLEQIVGQIGSTAPDAPWLIAWFGRLGEQQRRKLVALLRREGRQALVLDDALIMFLGMSRGNPLEDFFACTLPFTWVQPYSTNAGQIPPEIFFGRRAEMHTITARQSGGSLIYGGRQLGKSALLNQIRLERHKPNKGELALYMDIKPFGGPAEPADKIWTALAHELRRSQIPSVTADTPQVLADVISNWLSEDPDRRILAMFDETDKFLAAEHRADYPNLRHLKRLMEQTFWRFKAVFAGLHNVRRMAQAPNSPLPHLGEPICIGPMNLTVENRAELRRLAVEPMRAAGFEYAETTLAWDMLARMNYYPSLVQVFSRQVIESVGRRPPPGQAGPRWVLDREMLFEGETAERIAGEIRDRFQLTLNLDVRYELIAKSIALSRLDRPQGDRAVLTEGLTLDDIDKLLELWPERTPRPSRTDLKELLDEMVSLGVLGDYPNGRYGLRSALVAQMLGQRDQLVDDLLTLADRDSEADYDAGLFYRSLRPNIPYARAPLTDRQLDALFNRKSKPLLRFVVGNPAVSGTDIAERMVVTAGLWDASADVSTIRVEEGGESTIRKAAEKLMDKHAILIVDGVYSERIERWLLEHEQLSKGKLIVIWCINSHLDMRAERENCFQVGRWSETMLRHWLYDEGLAPGLDDRETREAIMSATGGAPARVIALRQLLHELAPATAAQRLRRIAVWRNENSLTSKTLGIGAAGSAVLRALHDYGGAITGIDDLRAIEPRADDATLGLLVHEGLVQPTAYEAGRPDPPVLTWLGRLVDS